MEMFGESLRYDPVKATRQDKWDRRFLELAQHVATWSKDPSSKIGAVIVNDERIVIGMGYNGFPRGCNDSPEIYADRAKKLTRVVHAELNAILNANGTTRGATLYVSGLPPCDKCAASIVQAGIKRVVFVAAEIPDRWKESTNAGFETFADANVAFEGFSL